MVHLKIVGTGSYLPEEVIPNSFFTERDLEVRDGDGILVDKKRVTEESVFKTTGIRERRRAKSDQWPSDLGYEAARQALDTAGIAATDLTGIVCATVTEDSNFPCAGQRIQEQLGATGCDAFDIAYACAGFPKALEVANALVLRNSGNYLVVAAETLWNMVDEHDLNSTLFGDGAGAAVLVPTEHLAEGIVSNVSGSNPFDGRDGWIYRDAQRTVRMPHGRSVLKDAVKEMVAVAKTLKEQAGWNRADVYIPHQANGRIIEKVAERVEPDSEVYSIIETTGNMSAATCAVGLDRAIRDGTIHSGSKVVITAYGAGAVRAGTAIQF